MAQYKWRQAGLVAAMLVALAACAQVDAPTVVAAPQAVLAPETEAALRRVSATIAGASGFTVRARTLRELTLPEGQTVLFGGTSAIAARRPDRLFAMVGSDLGNFGLWYDGRAVTVLIPTDNVYGVTPLTGDLEQAAALLEERLGIEIPVRPLLAADPFAAMLAAGPTAGSYLGRSYIRDTPVDHHVLRNQYFDWEIWIEVGPRALPRRVSIVENAGNGPRVTMEFDDWNLAPRLPDRSFTFVPPPGAVQATVVALPEAGPQGVPR